MIKGVLYTLSFVSALALTPLMAKDTICSSCCTGNDDTKDTKKFALCSDDFNCNEVESASDLHAEATEQEDKIAGTTTSSRVKIS